MPLMPGTGPEKVYKITQDKVLNELAAIEFSNGADFAQVVEEPIIINGSPGSGAVGAAFRGV